MKGDEFLMSRQPQIQVEDQRQAWWQKLLAMIRPGEYQAAVDKDIEDRVIQANINEMLHGEPPLRRFNEGGVIYDNLTEYQMGRPARHPDGRPMTNKETYDHYIMHSGRK